MSTLTIPSLELRLRTVGEAVMKDPLEETTEGGLAAIREIRQDFADSRQELEDSLAKGMEARSFVAFFGPALPAVDNYLIQLRGLLAELAGAEETSAADFVAELRQHEQETEGFRVRLAEALSLASRPPRKIDWDRLKRESDAEFAAGHFTTLATPEDVFKGLADGD